MVLSPSDVFVAFFENLVGVHLLSKAELKELDNDGEFDMEAPDE